jgi:HEAT repeat protein
MSTLKKKKPFSEVLSALAEPDHPLTAAVIYGLSDLDREQIAQLERAWPDYPVERRRALVEHLNEVSEANFDMDFRAINHLALTDLDGAVRRLAVEGLWEDESLSLMYKLVHIVQQDADPQVRAAAIAELGRFILLGEYEKISAADARLAQDTVLHVFRTETDNDLRRRALEAIANSCLDSVPGMIREMYASQEVKMRASALFAMGRTCDDMWAAEILHELSSSEPELRYEAARAAGQMELQEAVPHLKRLIAESDDPEILEVAIWALGEIGGDQARRILTQVAARAEQQGDEEISAAARDALDAANMAGEFLLFDFEP